MYYGFVVLSKIIFWLKKKQKQKREEKDRCISGE